MCRSLTFVTGCCSLFFSTVTFKFCFWMTLGGMMGAMGWDAILGALVGPSLSSGEILAIANYTTTQLLLFVLLLLNHVISSRKYGSFA